MSMTLSLGSISGRFLSGSSSIKEETDDAREGGSDSSSQSDSDYHHSSERMISSDERVSGAGRTPVSRRRRHVIQAGVTSSGTILQSSIEKHRRTRLSTIPSPDVHGKVSIFGGNASGVPTLVNPIDEDDVNADGKSDMGSVSSFGGSLTGSSKKKLQGNALAAADFLYLMQSVMDLGINAPQTKTIADMTNIARAQILAKFFYYMLTSQRQSVFIIDEAQWLDSQSWILLEKVARRARHSTLVLSGRKNSLEVRRRVYTI